MLFRLQLCFFELLRTPLRRNDALRPEGGYVRSFKIPGQRASS